MKVLESKRAALEFLSTVLSALAGVLMLFAVSFTTSSVPEAGCSDIDWQMIIISDPGFDSLELERTLWHTGASDDNHRCAGAWSLNHDVCEAVTQGS
ncbi:hypothetical protein ACJO2E_04665 [Marinobacter sp. M1N3S26]|uniref:hypothetical protein n=1 Tax=Marinobacter sp. M1N3S26 TaxID=3382299 RepID=UPI00387B34B0